MSVIRPYRYLDKAEIERQASDLLMRIQTQRKRSLRWSDLAEAATDVLDIGVVWDSIPPDEAGPIAAMILPLEREIVINKSISDKTEGYVQSTIAHEIGHWMLHINHDAIDKFIERLDFKMETESDLFLCRSVSSPKGIEWQAQYFASCLLMPRFKLEELKRGRNLTKWPHLYAMQKDLGVTISNLTNRLQDLEWIYIPKDSKQIYPGRAAS